VRFRIVRHCVEGFRCARLGIQTQDILLESFFDVFICLHVVTLRCRGQELNHVVRRCADTVPGLLAIVHRESTDIDDTRCYRQLVAELVGHKKLL
jgi:hypothetical protein